LEIFAVKIESEINPLHYQQLIEYLPYDRKEKILNYRFHHDSIRSYITELLLQYILHKNLGANYVKNGLQKNKYGKPYIKSDKNLHFNISHSGAWVVCVTHDNEVGIDIEEVKLIDLEIAKFSFSKREFLNLMNTKALKRPEYFYELWTLKESFVKAVGKGLSFPLDSFSMKADLGGWKPIIENNEIYYFRQYDIDKDYRMAVCTKNKNFCEEVKILTEDSLCNLMLTVYQNSNKYGVTKN